MIVIEEHDPDLYDIVQERNLARQYDLLINCIELIGLYQGLKEVGCDKQTHEMKHASPRTGASSKLPVYKHNAITMMEKATIIPGVLNEMQPGLGDQFQEAVLAEKRTAARDIYR